MPQSVLVTGATGLVGSKLVRALAEQHTVHAMGRHRPDDLPSNVSWWSQDLRQGLERLPATADAVVHLAQSEHFRDFPSRAHDVFAVNVASTVALLDWARLHGVTKFVLASTGGVYAPGERYLREDDVVDASTVAGFYPATKLAAEVLARQYSSLFDVVVLRPFFVYGAGQSADMLVPRLVHAVATGEAVRLVGPDGIRIRPLHVTDAVRAIQAAIQLEDSEVINIAGPEVLTLREMCTAIGRHLGTAPRFETTDTPAQSGDLVADIRKMTGMLGAPRIRFDDGVRDLCDVR